MKPRFKKAAKVLILSHRHYCLISGTCSACAVGNLIFATQKLTCDHVLKEHVNDKSSFKRNKKSVRVRNLWSSGNYQDLQLKTIMGYTHGQLDLIESAFEFREITIMATHKLDFQKTEYGTDWEFLSHLYKHVQNALDIEENLIEHVKGFTKYYDDNILEYDGNVQNYLSDMDDEVYDEYIIPRLMCVLSIMHWFDSKKFPHKTLIEEWLRLCDRTSVTDEEVTTYFA